MKPVYTVNYEELVEQVPECGSPAGVMPCLSIADELLISTVLIVPFCRFNSGFGTSNEGQNGCRARSEQRPAFFRCLCALPEQARNLFVVRALRRYPTHCNRYACGSDSKQAAGERRSASYQKVIKKALFSPMG